MDALSKAISGVNKIGDSGANFQGLAFPNRGEFSAWIQAEEGKSSLPISLFQYHVTLLHRVYTVLMGEHREIREAKVISDRKVKNFDVL